MKKRFITAGATVLLLGSLCFVYAQSRVTVTGGPGSDDDVVTRVGQAASDTAATAANGPISEERIRQIVREELQRAGLLPPPGMNTGPFGVSPNPTSPPQTNGNAGGTNIGTRPGAISGVATGRVVIPSTVARPPAGVGTPRAAGATPGGTAGTISGGSSGVGVATPSGAGAIRTPTTATPSGPAVGTPSSPVGPPPTGAAGSRSGTGQ